MIRSQMTDMFGIDYPICGFSHSRDVVVALSSAGGLGVLGTSRFSPAQLDRELSAIDEALEGRPYGVTIIFPQSEGAPDVLEPAALLEQIPDEYWTFLHELAGRFGIPLEPGPSQSTYTEGALAAFPLTREQAMAILDVVKKHPVALVSSAIGAPPRDAVDELHSRGVRVCGQVGHPKHVRRHLEAGVDLIVATGTEAAGHTGEIGSVVLVPQIVRAAGEVAVLAAGGFATGKQLVAALALGAAGVWTGSAWLVTEESDLPDVLKHKLLAASCGDTIRSRSLSGRMSRQLRTPWVEAWHEPGALEPLQAPHQMMLVKDAQAEMLRPGHDDVIGTPLGQVVGELDEIRSVREVVLEMVGDSARAAQRVVRALTPHETEV
jgi:NAD(P)H-dependent flavin oxidoreductase YrpB (nitropropane dioxygenase family)